MPIGRRLARLGLAAFVAAGAAACAAPDPTPAATRAVRPPDPATVVAAITEDGIRTQLDRLATVTDPASGYRSAGSPGFEAAAEQVAGELRAAGWTVSEDVYTAPTFADDGGSRLEADGTVYRPGDIAPLTFAPAGEVSGPLMAIDWVPGATDRTGKGCQVADYGALPDDAIVLVRPGPCFRRDQVLAAQAAGAAGFVAGYSGAPVGAAPRATLIDPDGLDIPAVAAAGPVADALATLDADSRTVELTTTATTRSTAARSVIAELPGSDPSRVVMLGAHLDSVIDGPGMNDDGSGVAALLELARALRGTRPRATIRLALWSGEEAGLQGSGHYVRSLTEAQRTALVAYLNADMIGSPNGYTGVYDDPGAAAGSTAINALLDAAVERAGGAPVGVDTGGATDHFPFAEAGIPTGGVFSGAGEALDTPQAASHGGTTGQPADACYHRPCDEVTNVDLGLARLLAAALTDVAVRLANTPDLVRR